MVSRSTSLAKSAAVPGVAPRPPAWATELVGADWENLDGGLRVRRSDRFALMSITVSGDATTDGPSLEEATRSAYLTLANHIRGDACRHPVRIWNFIPDILAPGGGGLDRYMRFNAGRHAAFTQWFGSSVDFDMRLPTASAVGHTGRELVIHALSCNTPGVAIVNPRQLSPHRYSERFGPKPPCFARATLLPEFDGPRKLLVGGTASVLGEDSVHAGVLAAQLDETFENLAALITAAFGGVLTGMPLHHFRELRVYHVSPDTSGQIGRAISAAFAPDLRVEWLQADLCRNDLAVEIEGLADIE